MCATMREMTSSHNPADPGAILAGARKGSRRPISILHEDIHTP